LYFRPNPFFIGREPYRRVPPLLDFKEECRVKSENEEVRHSQDEDELGYEYFRAHESSTSQMKDENGNDRSLSIQEIESNEAGSKPKEYKDI
jgi:hypothetical protein